MPRPLTKEEQKAENSRAHLDHIREDISAANEALTSVLNQVASAKAERDSVKEEIQRARVEVGDLEGEANRIKADIDHDRRDLAQREESLVAEKESFRLKKEEDLAFIESERENAVQDIENARQQFIKLLTDINKTNEELKTLKAECESYENLFETVKDLKLEIHELNLSLESQKKRGEKDIADLDKQITDKNLELKDVERRVIEEIAKIEMPREALAKEEAKMQRRLANFEILRKRLEKHYKQLFPDLSITLLDLD